ncbi:substrate-binding periplasmic protein [Salidesulfovibrio brasiliensis]|uniref:substrate-binding periplasmic protein n=1 Tax=Salidesulfovibrio brasiliensis TaxID=221711 RepID=UPI0006CF57AA|nr:transporter substrate-binding domain-containing protein [Salidesulfovibrio brasiliensis]
MKGFLRSLFCVVGSAAVYLFMVQSCFANEVIVINSSYSVPLSSAKSDGFFDLVLKEAFGGIGEVVDIQLRPAERSLRDANEGLADGDVGRVEGIDLVFPNLVRVPEPVLDERSFVAFCLKGRVQGNISWNELHKYRVGYVHGWKIFDLNTNTAKERTSVVNTEHLFEILKAGRIDIALSARLDGLAMASRLGINDIEVLEPPLAVKKMYLYLNSKHSELVEPLAASLKKMKKNGRYDALMRTVEKRYFSLKGGHGVD